MGIGIDIYEVLQELGIPITITHPLSGEVVTGEKFDYDDSFYNSSTEFLRNFGISGSFQYNTEVVPGDLVSFLSTNHLLLSSKETVFEGEIVTVDSFLVICNVDGRFSRRDGTTRNSKGEIEENLTIIQDSVKGLQYERMNEALKASDEMSIPKHSEILYTTDFPSVKVEDRWFPDKTDLTDYRRVVAVHRKRYSGCMIVYLDTDSR